VSRSAEIAIIVIAAATLVTALVQIAVLVAAGLLARRLQRLVATLEQDMKPVFGHLDRIGHEASRAAVLASAQVERVDALFADVVRRVDDTVGTLQRSVVGPVTQGTAIVRGFQAAFSSLRRGRGRRARPGSESEDALFI
jgi:hypothetical protein